MTRHILRGWREAATLVAAIALFGFIAPAAAQTREPHPAGDLTAQASDPTAPVVQLQITNFFSPSVSGTESSTNVFQFQPVIPVHSFLGIAHVFRLTVPVATTPEPFRDTGLGDINVVDLMVPAARSWGIWGFGYTLTLPTSSSDNLTMGDSAFTNHSSNTWQIGPAATAIYYGIKNWQIGGVFQNPVSFAGGDGLTDVNQFVAQPVINYLIGPWYLGAGDFSFVFDWKDGGAATVPLAFQVGRITTIGGQKFNLSAELEWTAFYPEESLTARWGVRLGLVLLLPEG